jgi:hypothetical protein
MARGWFREPMNMDRSFDKSLKTGYIDHRAWPGAIFIEVACSCLQASAFYPVNVAIYFTLNSVAE